MAGRLVNIIVLLLKEEDNCAIRLVIHSRLRWCKRAEVSGILSLGTGREEVVSSRPRRMRASASSHVMDRLHPACGICPFGMYFVPPRR